MCSSDLAAEGVIVAYASVFDNVDSYGDVIRRGAFRETLAEWEASGNQIPLLYGHDFADPFSNIGVVTHAEEDEHGLRVEARLDLDNPKAAQVYRLMKERRLSKMSFAFRVLDSGSVSINGEDAWELTRVKLYEVSVVPIGANEQTEILTVKSSADISTVVKQAVTRDSVSTEAEKSNADNPPSESSEVSNSKARVNAARAFLMLAERSTHEH